MKAGKLIFGAMFALSLGALAVSLHAAGRMQNRIKTLEGRLADASGAVDSRGCDAAANSSTGVESGRKDSGGKKEVRELAVEEVYYDGKRSMRIFFSAEPDAATLKHFITAGPLSGGGLVVSRSREYRPSTDTYETAVRATGDFMYRTNLTLRIRSGLPAAAQGVAALKEDYVKDLRRDDESPRFAFRDSGRYLSPAGDRLVAVEAVNVTNLVAEIRPVPRANIIHMLALEECAYSRIYKYGWGSDAFVEDLAGSAWSSSIVFDDLPNKWQSASFSLSSAEAEAGNGVYLASLSKEGEVFGSVCHRVICLSDLALSCRAAGGETTAWVTRLSDGRPVAGATVAVYTSANIMVARGVTGEDGWCRCEKIEDGKPFALVAWNADGSDSTFLQLTGKAVVEETYAAHCRPAYLDDGEFTAFSWSERGIYRHGEKICVESIVRGADGKAPPPMPVNLVLRSPSGEKFDEKTLVTDSSGAVSWDGFSVPDDRPSGEWCVETAIPGFQGGRIAARKVRIEEFAPPQIRVEASAVCGGSPGSLEIAVKSEYLTGEPAEALRCDVKYMLDMVDFRPAGWEGWKFGDGRAGFEPFVDTLEGFALDKDGKAAVSLDLSGKIAKAPSAVSVAACATVFEDGGRPANAITKAVIHPRAWYPGAKIADPVRLAANGSASIQVACVRPDGSAEKGAKRFSASLSRKELVYSYEKDGEGEGWGAWESSVKIEPVFENLEIHTDADGKGSLELKGVSAGDYVLTIEGDGASFSSGFYLAGGGDDSVRTTMKNPSKIELAADKPLYRPGETPRISLRSPFAGTALLEVFRDKRLYSRVFRLDSATAEIELDPVDALCAPSIDVALSVVQGVGEGDGHLAFRAHGETCVRIRDAADEIPVSLSAAAVRGGVEVELDAPGGEWATVALVDEGINILTGEKTPDPAEALSLPRTAAKTKYDLFGRLLPVVGEDETKIRGIKTGGDGLGDLLPRTSLEPSRRFKPLSLVSRDVRIVDGKARISFELPEFSGEVRVTAVARSARASGAAKRHVKISPALCMKPDAPRFAAPGDAFRATLPLYNRSGADGEVSYSVAWRMEGLEGYGSATRGSVRIAAGSKAVIPIEVKAPGTPGEMTLSFKAEGFGESRGMEILLPVRPAAAWVQDGGTVALKPGDSFEIPKGPEGRPFRFAYGASSTRFGELKSALEWLSDYPHGCLEQTSSRIFPLITAGGILNSIKSEKAENREAYVLSGVRRVESMIRYDDFVMWPDCGYAPWDRDVSLYAAHFLVEAYKSGVVPGDGCRQKIAGFLRRWANSTEDGVAAYACHTLALDGKPDKGKMLRLYGKADALSLISRARLARAFALDGDAKRARDLLGPAVQPETVKEAAFALLALLEMDADDPRTSQLAAYLTSRRDKTLVSWGTTEENAHALLALGAYYRLHPETGGKCEIREAGGKLLNTGDGTAFVSWRSLALPGRDADAETGTLLRVSRRYLDKHGAAYDTSKARRGDLVYAEITLRSTVERSYNDLVVQDLLPAGCEIVLGAMGADGFPAPGGGCDTSWVMRSDARDDRMLVYSKKFKMEKDGEVRFIYPVRVVSPGDYAVAGVSVEAMYDPALAARSRGGRFVVRD